MAEKQSNIIQLPVFTADAKKRWLQIPASYQKELMDNVWCGHCRTATKIRLQEGKMSGNSLVLSGTCKRCGGEAARVIEADG